jgi:hypothetical protein
LSAYGGEAIRDGVTVRAVDHTREELEENVVYLLFLTRSVSGEPGAYQIYNAGAFERSNGAARPLARGGADLYRDFSGRYADVIARVMQSARAR